MTARPGGGSRARHPASARGPQFDPIWARARAPTRRPPTGLPAAPSSPAPVGTGGVHDGSGGQNRCPPPHRPWPPILTARPGGGSRFLCTFSCKAPSGVVEYRGWKMHSRSATSFNAASVTPHPSTTIKLGWSWRSSRASAGARARGLVSSGLISQGSCSGTARRTFEGCQSD